MRRDFSPLELWRRLLTATLAVIVLGLAILAVSPRAHDLIHSDTSRSDDLCAVVLFAGGVSLPLSAITVPQPGCEWCAATPTPVVEVLLSSPRYLRQPERGPPASAMI